jgi:hypothetical protein
MGDRVVGVVVVYAPTAQTNAKSRDHKLAWVAFECCHVDS